MRHAVIIIFSLCLANLAGTTVFGQSNKDDLVREIEKSEESVHDSLYYELFRAALYNGEDLRYPMKYALTANSLSQKYNHSYIYSKSCRALGMLYNRRHDFDSARYYYYLGIQSAKLNNHTNLLVYTTNELGLHYENQDMYDSALLYYNVSLENAKTLDLKEDIAFALNNIGLVFYYLNNYKDALENLEASVDLKRKYDIGSMHVSLMNIGLIYNDQERYEDALELLREVEDRYSGQCNDYQLADLNFSLGYAYYHKAKPDHDRALNYFTKSYDFAKASNNKKAMANALHHFGLNSLVRQDYLKCQEYFDTALSLANELNLRRLKRDLYKDFQKLYSLKGDLEGVVIFQDKYMAIKDSIFNEQMANNLKEIQLNAQKKQSEAIIQEKDSEIERVRLITTLVGVISILLVAVSVLIYRNYRASHRMKKILEKEIEKRTGELVKSNSELTKMTQEYDQLVYRASHDIRGPLATLMGLTNIAKQDYDEPLRVKDYLGKIESTASGLNQTLSQLMETNRIRNLPICVEEIKISEVLDEVYSSFKSLNHFPLIQLRIEKGDWNTPLLSDRHLISFVLAKLLDNAFKYFSSYQQEKYIKVSWSQSEGKTVIAVEDNGQGISNRAKEKIFQLFYVASDVHGSGLGLFLAQMAANRLGGRVILARSSSPTVFKLIISTNLATAQVEDKPVMTVAS